MRLLRCSTTADVSGGLTFEVFEGQNIPPYVSISHVWGEDEVLFSHVQTMTERNHKGYEKLRCAMQRAAALDLSYLWMDTCCIDKSSSAELSEAINSMFAWYQNCAVCIVYMADLNLDFKPEISIAEFSQSRWFTRGWCLQELLAPKRVLFCDCRWNLFGTKEELCNAISIITGIDVMILSHTTPIRSRSIAQRMSWAARRQTTRVEDLAYCLMGIFDVNMPLLYGEGPRAFQRLQEEILKVSDGDDSILAWKDPSMQKDEEHGLLADSPASFAWSRDVVTYRTWNYNPHFQMTNRGLQVELSLVTIDREFREFSYLNRGDHYMVALNCPSLTDPQTGYIALFLHRLRGGNGQEYKRIHCNQLATIFERPACKTIYVPQRSVPAVKDMVYPVHYFRPSRPHFYKKITVLDVVYRDSGDTIIQPWPIREKAWLPPTCRPYFEIFKHPGKLSAAILFRLLETNFQFVLLLGSLTAVEVGIDVISWPENVKLADLETLEQKFSPAPEGITYHLDERHQLVIRTSCFIFNEQKAYEVIMYLNPSEECEDSDDSDTDSPWPQSSVPLYTSEDVLLNRPLPPMLPEVNKDDNHAT